MEDAQTFFAGLRAGDGELPAFKQVAQDGERGRLVVDDECALEVQRRQPCGAVCIRRLARGQAEADGEGEGAAAAGLAGDGDAAAHQLDELAADRQPEAGAAEAPGDAGVDLAERLEQAGGLRRRKADAGVAHGDAQGDGVGRRVQRFDAHVDFAAFGELDRVADEVADHLAEAQRVAAQAVGHVRRDVDEEFEPFFAGGDGEEVAHVAQHVVEREVDMLDVDAAGLDLRVVEDVVEDAEQGA